MLWFLFCLLLEVVVVVVVVCGAKGAVGNFTHITETFLHRHQHHHHHHHDIIITIIQLR